MPRSARIAALAASTALAAVLAAPGHAEGTRTGTTIINTASVDFTVGGVDQTQVVASDSFSIDRKVNFTVTRVSAGTVTVVPGQQNAVIVYQVTNLSNDTIDLGLAAAQNPSGTDNFAAQNVRFYRDEGNGAFDGTEPLITYLDELGEDASATVLAVANVPINRVNGDLATLVLSATARSGGTAATQGAVITASSGANTTGVETVLADGAGATDGQRDGVFSASGTYTVSAATLTVIKTSRVVSDPLNNTTDPKAIPGAELEYCVIVRNAVGSAKAANVRIADPVPAELTYNAAFGIRIDGTADGSNNCNADGSEGGMFTGGSVTATLSDVAAGENRTLIFRATIR